MSSFGRAARGFALVVTRPGLLSEFAAVVRVLVSDDASQLQVREARARAERLLREVSDV